MKLTKDELLAKLNELAIEDEVKIGLLEDVSDTFAVDEVTIPQEDYDGIKAELADVRSMYEGLKERYKNRFFEGVNDPDPEPVVIDEPIVEEIAEVIDIKEI